LTLKQANEYLDLRKKAAKNIATATMLCILSVIPLLVLGAASELPIFIWSENLSCGIGLVAMFVIVALAVVIFVRTGLEASPYEFIVKEPFENEYGVVGFVKDAQNKFKSTYDKYKWIGSAVCILSPIPLFCGAFTGNDFLSVIMLAVLPGRKEKELNKRACKRYLLASCNGSLSNLELCHLRLAKDLARMADCGCFVCGCNGGLQPDFEQQGKQKLTRI